MKRYPVLVLIFLAILACSLTITETQATESEDKGKVACIGNTTYDTLKDAIYDASDENTIKLLNNTTESVTISNKKLTIDLNGYVITSNGGSAITISDGEESTHGILIITDSSQSKEGKITGSNASGIYIGKYAELTLSFGSISNNTNSGNGGGIFISEYGKFTMDGGSIDDNNILTSGGGGGVYVSPNSSFIMNGGSIERNNTPQVANKANRGGAVYVCSSFIMNGGTIKGNVGYEAGGAINIIADASFEMTGGSIIDNQSYGRGGAIHNYAGTIKITGGNISGNKGTDGGAIASWSNSTGKPATTLIEDCSFNNNIGSGNGGVFWICKPCGSNTFNISDFTLKLYNSSFKENSATNGNIIYSYSNSNSLLSNIKYTHLDNSCDFYISGNNGESNILIEKTKLQSGKTNPTIYAFAENTVNIQINEITEISTFDIPLIYVESNKSSNGYANITISNSKIINKECNYLIRNINGSNGGYSSSLNVKLLMDNVSITNNSLFVNNNKEINEKTNTIEYVDAVYGTTIINVEVKKTSTIESNFTLKENDSLIVYDGSQLINKGEIAFSDNKKIFGKIYSMIYYDQLPAGYINENPNRYRYDSTGSSIAINNSLNPSIAGKQIQWLDSKEKPVTEIKTNQLSPILLHHGDPIPTKHNITISGEGLTITSDNGSVTSGDKVDYGTILTFYADKIGHTYKITVGDDEISNNYTVVGDVTFTITYYPIEYLISFEVYGGSEIQDVYVGYGSKITKPSDPTKTGYQFMGWFSNNTLSESFDFNTAVEKKMTLYAKWTAKNYTLSFDANGGTIDTNSMEVTFDSTYSNLPTPARDGYAFVGWFTGSANGMKINNGSTVNITDNTTLYAHWAVAYVGDAYYGSLADAIAAADSDAKAILLVDIQCYYGIDLTKINCNGHTIGHNTTKNPAKAATCTEDGNAEHWKCSVCEKLFTGAEGTTEISIESVVISKIPHDMIPHNAVDATCTSSGNVEYWTCSRETGVYYADENGLYVLNDITIPAAHTLIPYEKVNATCTENGHEAYWKCSVCKKLFSDANGTHEINSPVIIDSIGHSLQHNNAVAATCISTGNIEYWSCSVCEKVFSNEGGTTEITSADTVVAKIPHTLVQTPYKAPTYNSTGNNEYWTCSVCGKVFKSDKTTETTVQAETIPKLTRPSTPDTPSRPPVDPKPPVGPKPEEPVIPTLPDKEDGKHENKDGSTTTITTDNNGNKTVVNEKPIENGKEKEEQRFDKEGNYQGSTVTTNTEETKKNGDKVKTESVEIKNDTGSTTSKVTNTESVSEDGSIRTVTKTEEDGAGNTSSQTDTTITVSVDTVDGKVDDKKVQNALDQMNGSSTEDSAKTVTIITEENKGQVNTVTISPESMKAIADTGAQIRMGSQTMTVDLTDDVVTNLSGKNGDISLSIGYADKEQLTDQQKKKVGDSTLLSISTKAGDESIHQLGGKVTVTLPYELKDDENPNSVKVYYVDDDGNLTQMVTKYDAATKTVSFETTHFSYYMIGDDTSMDEPIEEDEGSGNNITMIAGIAIVIVAIICVGAFVMYRRH